jgi:hypothetical protein
LGSVRFWEQVPEPEQQGKPSSSPLGQPAWATLAGWNGAGGEREFCLMETEVERPNAGLAGDLLDGEAREQHDVSFTRWGDGPVHDMMGAFDVWPYSNTGGWQPCSPEP